MSRVDIPGASYTVATGINDSGQVIGYYGGLQSGRRGFVRDASGGITLFDVPATTDTAPAAINASGQIAGAIFGDGPAALRLPAVLFGVASIAALYLFARRVTTVREALVAAALMTVSYHHIWFSQNARGYSALLFWTLVSSWLFARALR